MSLPAASWLPDPLDSRFMRYWDGVKWTGFLFELKSQKQFEDAHYLQRNLPIPKAGQADSTSSKSNEKNKVTRFGDKKSSKVASGYAVLDLETNGLKPWDDVLEYAVVLLDENFNVESEHTSLLRAKKMIRTGHINNIHEEEILEAPYFKEVIPELASLFQNRFLVGHNVNFDRGFILNEVQNHASLHYVDRRVGLKEIDTQWIAKELCGVRKLTDATEKLKIKHDNAHSALADARATAELLQKGLSSNSLGEQKTATKPWKPVDEAIEIPAVGRVQRLDSIVLRDKRQEWLKHFVADQKSENEEAVEAYYSLLVSFIYNLHLSNVEKAILAQYGDKVSFATMMRIHEEVASQIYCIDYCEAQYERTLFLLKNLVDSLGISKVSLKSEAEPMQVFQENTKVCLSGRFHPFKQTELEELFNKHGFISSTIKDCDFVLVGNTQVDNAVVKKAQEKYIPVIDLPCFMLHNHALTEHKELKKMVSY